MLGHMKEIEEDFPWSKVFVSVPFPISEGPLMDGVRKTAYNLMIFGYGAMIKTVYPSRGTNYVMNRCMWFIPSEGRQQSVFFRPDGLHLNRLGCDAVAAGWLRQISK